MHTIYRSGINFIHGPKQRLEIHWNQIQNEPFKLQHIQLYTYRIPIIGPKNVQKILSFLNGDGIFIGEKPHDLGLKTIGVWLERNHVPKNLRDQLTFSLKYLVKWDDIDHARITLSVIKRIVSTKANILTYTFNQQVKMSEQEYDLFLEAVNAVRPGTEIEVFGSTFHCRLPN